jgi:hypothetical protein
MTATTAATTAARLYWRCTDCLSGFVTAEPVEPEAATCALCEGKVRMLGPVDATGTRWVDERYLPPCDGRCTHARGYRCECVCRGANHGSKLVVTIQRDGGLIRLSPSFDTKGAAERAAEYRAAREQLRAAIDKEHGRSWSGYWREAFRDLENMATHQGRMKRIARLRRNLERGWW